MLVYDLGGGTFDVSIIEIRDRVFEVKATGGDIFLGGLDFDNAMIHHVLTDFAAKTGIDLSTDPVAMQRIKDLAERTKMRPQHPRPRSPFNIPFITMTAQGQPLNIEMTLHPEAAGGAHPARWSTGRSRWWPGCWWTPG